MRLNAITESSFLVYLSNSKLEIAHVPGLKNDYFKERESTETQQIGDKREQQGCQQLILAKHISQHILFSSS